MSDTRVDLPSPKAPNFEQRVRETLMTYMGRQGNPLDRGLTLRDLLENGIVKIRDGYSLKPGAGSVPLLPVVSPDELDLTPPPTPTGFAVNSAISHVFIEHDAPAYAQGGGHLRTRVYGVTYTGGPLPVFTDAIEIAQFAGTVHAHPSNPATTWRLWIKWETRANVLSPTPAGGTNGLEVTTGEDVAKLLEALTGQITESQLYADLNTRINLIDGPASTPGTVAFQVAAEAGIRADQLAIESHQRLIGVQSAAEAALSAAIAADNERLDRIQDVAIARTELYTDIQQGLSAEAGERTLLAAQIRGGYTGNDLNQVTTGLLYQERIARANQDEALSLQITLLAAGVGEQFDWARIWYFDTDAEGWGGNGAPSAVAGFLRPANTGSNAYVNTPPGLNLDSTKYKQVRLRIRKVGSPTFAGFLWWNGPAQSWDAARRVTLTEPTYDANNIGLLTVNTEWTGPIDQLRLDLSSAQTGTDYFEVDWFAVGRPSPGASTAQLLEEQQARATADSAEATARETLATAILGQADPAGLLIGNLTQGLLYEERQARSTTDSAIAQDVSTLQASFTSLTGDVSTLSSTVSTLEQAVADTTGTGANFSQELRSVQRKLDVDAETVLRNTVNGEVIRTGAETALAFAREDLSTRINDGLSAEASARLLLAAQVNTNTASITSVSNALATAEGSLSTQINTVSATANAKNRTYYQTAAPTNNLVTGDLWFDTDDGNKPYRWSGSGWVETTDTRITANTAAIQNEASARATAISAEASARQTLQATVESNNTTLTTAIETEATTRATQTGDLFSKYTVKIDTNGYVSGFGLASSANNATPFSDFAVRADRFYIANPSGPGVAPAMPFIVQTTPTTINGVSVPVGVYLTDAFIQNGTISNAKIANLAVDNAKISDLSADKITAGSIAVGQHIQSTGYVAGSAGWRIDGNGNAELSNAVVRGTVVAGAGSIGGNTIDSTGIQSPNYAAGSAGWRINSSGSIEANTGTFRGAVRGSEFTTGAMTGYAWPAINTFGTYLGPSGLLIGNANNNKYLQVTFDGNIYTPNFDVVNGNMTAKSFSTVGGRFSADASGLVIADRVSIRRRDAVATGSGYWGGITNTTTQTYVEFGDGGGFQTNYSQDATTAFWLDTGIDDSDFNNFNINQQYGALLRFTSSYIWWQSGNPTGDIFSTYIHCEPRVRETWVRTGQTGSGNITPRIWLYVKIALRDIATNGAIYQIRLDNYSWSLFKL
jgi:hypothetical protein